MSLITVLAMTGATSLTAQVVMPINAALASREFIGFGQAYIGAASAGRIELAIDNCKADSGATFTARFSQAAATGSGYFTEFPVGTFIAGANQLTTLTGTSSAASNATMYVCYNEIPVGGSDNWTAKV